MSTQDRLDQLHQHLNFKPLNRGWAMAELFIGFAVASAGLLIGVHSVAATQFRLATDYPVCIFGVILMVCGCYLASAGHRSLLYQSMNKLAAWVVARLEPPATVQEDEP